MGIFKTNSKNKYTFELSEILEYMNDTLNNEFPTDVFTLEYLVLSILDNKNCHANLILDSCLMSDNLDALRKVYVAVLEKHMKPQLKKDNPKYNDELSRTLELALAEANKMNQNKIGTEHVLLAILNKENEFRETEIFDKFMLEYDFIFNKCNVVPNNENSTQKHKKLATKSVIKKTNKITKSPNISQNDIPLKSQVNTKTISISNGAYVDQFTTNLNKLAKNGKIDELVGRKDEINEIIEILSRRKKNNAILVGDGGVGKTAIIYGLAKMIEDGNAPSALSDKEIIMINSMSLVSGTHFRGMLEERVNGLFKEIQNNDKYILFLDDIHTMLKSGSKEKDGDISGLIGNTLSDGTVKIIATTNFKEYKNTIEINSSISRKLQKVIIEPTSIDDTIKILENNKKYYEKYHNVEYDSNAIKKAVELADRYITDRKLPDSAFDVIDLAGSKASLIETDPIEIRNEKKRLFQIKQEKDSALNQGDFEKIDSLSIEENVIQADLAEYKRELAKNKKDSTPITEIEISNVVSEFTKIPVNKLSSEDKKKLADIDKTLKESIIGQDEAIDTICKVIKRNKVGLGDKTKTIANIFMCGKSGTGKSLVAKKLAEEIFGDANALIRIDMSEYSEKSSVSKLLGSSAGYVGYENGGMLTEAVKNKQYCVLLLDEIEKANSEVHNIFLQLFDDGRLTDGSGQIINFKNVIVLMTSNIGAQKAMEFGNGLGFTKNQETNSKNIVEKELKHKFTPEFLNRIDKIVHFNTLSDDNLKEIVKLEINKFNKRLNNIGYSIICSDDVIDKFHKQAIKQKDMGARPILRMIQDELEDNITDLLLRNEYEKGYEFDATCVDNKIHIN